MELRGQSGWDWIGSVESLLADNLCLFIQIQCMCKYEKQIITLTLPYKKAMNLKKICLHDWCDQQTLKLSKIYKMFIIYKQAMPQKQHPLLDSNSHNSDYRLSDEILNSYDFDSFPINPDDQIQQFKYALKSRKSQGNWTIEEERKFLRHMTTHKIIYQDQQLRRTHKIFKKMSKHVKTRTSEQCKSHHQKLMIKHKSYDGIISSLESKVRGPQNLEDSDDGIIYSPIQIEDHHGYPSKKSNKSTKLSGFNNVIPPRILNQEFLKQKKFLVQQNQLLKQTNVERDLTSFYQHNQWQIWRTAMNNTINLKILPQIFSDWLELAEF